MTSAEYKQQGYVPGPLERTQGVPLHLQLSTRLTLAIQGDIFSPGSRLPSEKQLAKAHSVGRDTVRRALETLETQGLITRRQGVRKGTFVNQSTEVVKENGHPQKTRQLEVAKIIFERISSGEYAPGTRIPPEKQLIEDLGFSQNTVKAGLSILSKYDLIERQPRRGTFVCEELPPQERLEELIITFTVTETKPTLEASKPRKTRQKQHYYKQIADDLLTKIIAGEYSPGDRMPSVQQLRADFNCSFGPITKALTILDEKGIIIREQGRGIFVRKDLPPKEHLEDMLKSSRPLKEPLIATQRIAEETTGIGNTDATDNQMILDEDAIFLFFDAFEDDKALRAALQKKPLSEITAITSLVENNDDDHYALETLKDMQLKKAIEETEKNSNVNLETISNALGIDSDSYKKLTEDKQEISQPRLRKLVSFWNEQVKFDQFDSSLEKITGDIKRTAIKGKVKGLGKQIIDLASETGMSHRDIGTILNRRRETVTAINKELFGLSVKNATKILDEARARHLRRNEAIAILNTQLAKREEDHQNSITIGHAIADIRETYRISQRALAERFPQFNNQTAISRTEAGEITLRKKDIVAFIDAFQKFDIPLENPTMQYLINQSRAIVHLADALTILKSDTARCQWNGVSSQVEYALLEQISIETGIPLALIGKNEMVSSLNFINGHTLKGLFKYSQREAKKVKQKPIDWLRKKIGIPTELSFEDLQYCCNHDRNIPWQRASTETLRDIFEHIAIETGTPIALIGFKEFHTPYTFLNGRVRPFKNV